MRKLLTAGALASVTTALITGLAFLTAGTAPDTAHANHNVTVGIDLDPSGNTATSLGTINDCLEVTAGPFDDDGDGALDEDPIGDANFDGAPGVAGVDDDLDTLIDEDWAGNEPGDPGYTNDLVADDDEDGSIDEDLPGQMFQFDVYVTDIGHGTDPGLTLFTIPVLFDDAVMNIASVDVYWFLQEGIGSNVVNTSDTQLPDLLDGWVDVGAADISGAADDKGTGVLARVTGMTVAPGVTTIEMPTIDRNADTVVDPVWDRGPWLKASDGTWIEDADGNQFFEGPVLGGTVAVDDASACNPDWDNDTVLNDADNCPNDANAGQEDMDGDGLGDVCDSDIDGDGFRNVRENMYASDPMVFAYTIEVCDGVDNDGDTTVDEDGLDHDNDGQFDDPNIDCNPGAPDTEDYDGDGFNKKRENWMATDIYDDCPDNGNDPALPPDVDNNTTINIGDVIQFRGVILTSFGDPGYDRRLDFTADMQVNIGDVLAAFMGRILTSCTP